MRYLRLKLAWKPPKKGAAMLQTTSMVKLLHVFSKSMRLSYKNFSKLLLLSTFGHHVMDLSNRLF